MEDWAPYGVGEPDEDGWYPDYRTPPEHLRPEAPTESTAAEKKVDIDGSILAIVTHWRIVVAELAERGIDLYDPATLARPWPGIRTVIFSLLDSPTRLRAALTRE